MSYANRGELKAALRSWLTEDNQDVLPDSTIEDAIGFVENDLNDLTWDGKLFRTKDMNEIKQTIILSDGEEYVSLPSDFLSMRYVTVPDNDQDPLTYLSPRAFDAKGTDVGYVRYYTIVAGQMRIKQAMNAGDVLEMNYYANIPALSSDTATNWLLAKRPMIYLYGGLTHLGVFLRDDNMLAKAMTAYERGVIGFIDADTQSVTAAGATEVQPTTKVA